MVTPELKWPTTNLTPSPTNLLATDTPCSGLEASSPNDSTILLAEDAAGRIDVGGGLLGALLELRAEGCVRARQRTADAELQVVGIRRCPAKASPAASTTPDRSFILMC